MLSKKGLTRLSLFDIVNSELILHRRSYFKKECQQTVGPLNERIFHNYKEINVTDLKVLKANTSVRFSEHILL